EGKWRNSIRSESCKGVPASQSKVRFFRPFQELNSSLVTFVSVRYSSRSFPKDPMYFRPEPPTFVSLRYSFWRLVNDCRFFRHESDNSFPANFNSSILCKVLRSCRPLSPMEVPARLNVLSSVRSRKYRKPESPMEALFERHNTRILVKRAMCFNSESEKVFVCKYNSCNSLNFSK